MKLERPAVEPNSSSFSKICLTQPAVYDRWNGYNTVGWV